MMSACERAPPIRVSGEGKMEVKNTRKTATAAAAATATKVPASAKKKGNTKKVRTPVHDVVVMQKAQSAQHGARVAPDDGFWEPSHAHGFHGLGDRLA